MDQPLDELINLHDAVEAAAYQDMFAAAPAAMARSLGLQVREIAGATLLIAAGMPTPMFNRVIGLGNQGMVDDNVLDTIMAIYREAGVNDWWLHVSPTTANVTLATQLAERGFGQAGRKSWAKMFRVNSPPVPVPSKAEIKLVASGEDSALAETVCAVFDMPDALAPWFAALATRPHWRAVAARLDNKIVGGGFLHLQGRHAWLGAGGVRPEARRLHAHRALMTLRIEHAIGAGCIRLFTETGEAMADEPNPSLRNMYACGFTHAYSRLNFAAPIGVD